jgi:hypothetical protein
VYQKLRSSFLFSLSRRPRRGTAWDEAALGVLVLLFHVFDKVSVFFVRWFRAPFFEQVVYAVGVLFVTSGSDVWPVVQRRFRLFD